MAEQLSDLGLTELPPTYDRRDWWNGPAPLHGVVSWGWDGLAAHNELRLVTLCVGKAELIADATLLDRSKPKARRPRSIDRYDFEPRWFRSGVVGIKGDYCALEEWIDPQDRERHIRRIVVFDSRTGEELKLEKPLTECQDLERTSL
jgi:hypothetical protein